MKAFSNFLDILRAAAKANASNTPGDRFNEDRSGNFKKQLNENCENIHRVTMALLVHCVKTGTHAFGFGQAHLTGLANAV